MKNESFQKIYKKEKSPIPKCCGGSPKSFKDCQKFKSYQDQTCKSSYTHVKVLNQTKIEVKKFLETEIFDINDPNICMGPKWTKPVDYDNLMQMQLFNCQPPCKGQTGPCIR